MKIAAPALLPVEEMMGKSTDFGLRRQCRFQFADYAAAGLLLAVALSTPALWARADSAQELLEAPKLPPYKWFASTDPKNKNEDYVNLKPGETRRVPLTRGMLVRLWSTGFEPEKITMALQNGARVELLSGGKAKAGVYSDKAYIFYPGEKNPPAARDLKDGAAIVVTNKSTKANKWFYQATVRPSGAAPAGTKPSLAASGEKNYEDNVNWAMLGSELENTAKTGIQQLQLSKNTKTPYKLCVASGSYRAQKGKPIPILNIDGEGAFVGLAIDIRPAPEAHRRTFAFLEGNETLIADGKKYEGTGTEDYFNSSWYFPDAPFGQPYGGMTFKSKEPPRVVAYRWMVTDAVPFKKNFKFELEQGNGNNSNDLEFRWVAFWYQKPPFKFESPDELKSGTGNAPMSAPGENQDGEGSFVPIFAALVGVVIVGSMFWIYRSRKFSGPETKS